MSAPQDPPRYVVLVWMWDHWGVSTWTDDAVEAERVREMAAEKVPRAVVVDTQDGGDRP